MNKYIKQLVESYFDDQPNFGKLFNLLLFKIKKDMKDFGDSGFSIVLNRQYDVMSVWDVNGNRLSYTDPHASSAKLDKPLYNKFIEYLKSIYNVELVDVNGLGSPEAYKWEIRFKLVNEGFFDDIEDDIYGDSSEKAGDILTHSADIAMLKRRCLSIFTNLTKFPNDGTQIISQKDIEKYIKYTKLAEFVLRHNSYISPKDTANCTFKVQLPTYDDVDVDTIIIDTTKTEKYGAGVFTLKISGDKIISAVLPNNWVFVGEKTILLELIHFIELYNELGFITETVNITTLNKINELDVNFVSSYNYDTGKARYYTQNMNDMLKTYVLKYPLPIIIINENDNVKYTKGIELSPPMSNIHINEIPDDLIESLSNNIKNTYKTKCIRMYRNCLGYNAFVEWSIKNNNILIPFKSKQDKKYAQDIVREKLYYWIKKQKYNINSYITHIQNITPGTDKQFGKYVNWKIDLEFDDINTNKHLFFEFDVNMYLSGKIDINCLSHT